MKLCELIHWNEWSTNTALTAPADDIQLTYAELDRWAVAIGARLPDRSLTAILVDADMPPWLTAIIILGIHRANGYFVCINVNSAYNGYANNQLIRLQPAVIIGQGNLSEIMKLGSLTNFGASEPLLSITSSSDVSSAFSTRLRRLKIWKSSAESVPDDRELAYVMQTSGSTGCPKTVYVPHRCVRPNIVDLRNRWSITQKDRVLLCAPFTFDPSIVQMYLAWSSGATLVCPRSPSPRHLVEALADVTVIQLTPSQCDHECRSAIFNEAGRCLRIMCFGGEVCPIDVVQCWQRSHNSTFDLYNIYGITELSSWSTIYRLEKHFDYSLSGVPLGEVLSETVLRIDATDGEVRDDQEATANDDQQEGILFVGSATRKCFIDNQVPILDGTVFQSTGDLVRRTVTGDLYHLGRADAQIKRNGKRINLHQIEMIAISNLSTIDSRLQTCCIYDDISQRIHLILCHPTNLNGAQKSEISDSIKSRLKNHLPDYMRPDGVLWVKEMPVSAHGKVDRAAVLCLVRQQQRNIGIDNYLLSSVQALDQPSPPVSTVSPITNANDDRMSSSLRHLGYDSLRMVHLISQLEQLYQLETSVGNRLFDLMTRNADNPLSEWWPMLRDMITGLKGPTRKRKLTPELRTAAKITPEVAVSSANVPTTTISTSLSPSLSSMRWSWHSGKCIDASPLVVETPQSDNRIVIIGSHSGRLAALDIENGEEKWCLKLEDRIEATAVAVIEDGSCVALSQ